MKICTALIVKLALAIALFANLGMADESSKTKARQHFKQGVELFDQRRFGDALLEFEQSYSLFPVYSTLYNVGQVHVALGHPVQAVDTFEKFLVQGGASIAPDQRARAEAELVTQSERIGDIKFDVSPAGVEVRVDGDPIGKAPIKDVVKVAAGHHRIEALLYGYRSEESEVHIAGGGHVELTLKLRALAAESTPSATPAPVASAPNGTPTRAASSPAPTTPVNSPPPPQIYIAQPSLSSNSDAPTGGGAVRTFGYLFATGGLLAGGIGVAYAIDGQSKHDDALNQVANGDSATAQQTEREANKEKTKGYIVIGSGGAAMLLGTIFILAASASQSNTAHLSIRPWVASNATGASVGGTW